MKKIWQWIKDSSAWVWALILAAVAAIAAVFARRSSGLNDKQRREWYQAEKGMDQQIQQAEQQAQEEQARALKQMQATLKRHRDAQEVRNAAIRKQTVEATDEQLKKQLIQEAKDLGNE